MGYSSHVGGALAALFYLAIFNQLDSGLATLRTGSIRNIRNTVTVPELSVRPVPRDAGTSDALIWYQSTNVTSYSPWVTSLETFLDDYRLPGRTPQRGQNIVLCDYDEPPPPGRVCDVDVRDWHLCTAENHFGYHRSTPCIFLKLDTPPGWTPLFYNDTNALPAGMPLDLKSQIQNLASTNNRALNTVWVSCEGQSPADVEFIGPVQYFPRRGFPGYYFTNNNVDGYLSPLVALHIRRPNRGIVINIKCKAWARNIDNNNAQGIVQFGLLID